MDYVLLTVFGVAVLGYLIWFGIAFPIQTFQKLKQLEAQVAVLERRLLRGASAPEPAYDLAPPQPVAPTRAPQQPPVHIDSAPARREPPPEAIPLLEPAPPLEKPAPSGPPPRGAFDLEALVGANWLAKLGAAAVVLAVAFFLQYAFASGWIGPEARVIGGLVVAAAMLGTGQYLLPRTQYRRYAQALFSGGIVAYFLSIYAAQHLYHLIGFVPAFAALAVGALAASALSVANETEIVSALCVAGAFAVPVLIQRPEGAGGGGPSVQLYVYLAALNAWVALLIRLRPWHSLSVIAFAATWLLFFASHSLAHSGWVPETFAGAFLLANVYLGLSALRESRAAEGAGSLGNAGIGLVLGGAVAFLVASEVALGGAGILGLPAASYAPLAVALGFAGLALALPPLPHRDTLFRRIAAVAAAVALVVSLTSALLPESAVPVGQIPAAFAFTVFNLLVFGAIGLLMARRLESRSDGAILLAATGFVHAVMIFAVLGRTAILGAPAVALWLPIASCLALATLALHERVAAPAAMVNWVLAGVAVGLIALAGLATLGDLPWSARGAALFFVEYLVVTVAWVWLSAQVRLPGRVDLVAALVAASALFACLSRSLGMTAYDGVVVLAVVALAQAAVAALTGRWLLARRRDDLLGRLIYLGLGLTFATIAIPLQLKAAYVTVAWSVEAAVLLWTANAANEPRARWYGLLLLGVAAFRALALDLPVESAHLGVFRPLLNLRSLAGGGVVASAYYGFFQMSRVRETLSELESLARLGLVLLANAFTLVFVSVDLWSQVGAGWPSSGTSAQQLTLSVFWAIYALAAAGAGIWRRIRSVRLFAIGLLYVAILKVFLWDLSGLEQPYRIVSFFALGVILLATSLLYTRFEDRLHEQEALA